MEFNHGVIKAAILVLWGNICNNNIYGDICAISRFAMGTYAETLKRNNARGDSIICKLSLVRFKGIV